MSYTIEPPQGEMILFNNQQEVKEFFSIMGMEPEELAELGVYVKETDEEDEDEREFICEYERGFQYPVFDNNMYYDNPIDDRHAGSPQQFTYNPENITLDPRVYDRDYPMVAFVHIEDSFDRVGDVKYKVFQIEPLSLLWNMDRIKSMVRRNSEKWEYNHDQFIKYEETRREHLSSKG